jgi:hypothetical protein
LAAIMANGQPVIGPSGNWSNVKGEICLVGE